MSERFFRSNRPGYPHPVISELENSDIRVAVGDCSVTERRRWRPPYQTDKTVHVHAKHYKHNKDGRTAPGVCGNGSVPLSHSGNVVTRIGKYTHDLDHHNLKSELFQAVVIPNITEMLYQNRLKNEVARAMKKGEHVCHLRGHNSRRMALTKIPFLSCTCMSELRSKFQTLYQIL